ncbi:hypothetical protein LTR65_010545 [Meristemomyces frigidus]
MAPISLKQSNDRVRAYLQTQAQTQAAGDDDISTRAGSEITIITDNDDDDAEITINTNNDDGATAKNPVDTSGSKVVGTGATAKNPVDTTGGNMVSNGEGKKRKHGGDGGNAEDFGKELPVMKLKYEKRERTEEDIRKGVPSLKLKYEKRQRTEYGGSGKVPDPRVPQEVPDLRTSGAELGEHGEGVFPMDFYFEAAAMCNDFAFSVLGPRPPMTISQAHFTNGIIWNDAYESTVNRTLSPQDRRNQLLMA